jgi:hypothetical protein
MKTYYVELTKIIVVPFDAESEKEAVELAINDDSGFDGAWERAEPYSAIVYAEEVIDENAY